MAEVPDIQVLVKGFRAVANADIIINGITLVAGENGSGKSSISKLLYFFYKTVANYDEIVKHILNRSVVDIIRVGEIIQTETRTNSESDGSNQIRKDLNELRDGTILEHPLKLIEQKLIDFIEKIKTRFHESLENNQSTASSKKQDRVRRILSDILDRRDKDSEQIEELFAKVKELVKRQIEKAETLIDFRPTAVFIAELEEIFSKGNLPGKFEVLEYGSTIVALDISNISIPYSIQNAVYIDSPMMFHADYSKNIHWEDLANLLNKKGEYAHAIADIIGRDIMSGEVITDEMSYSRDDFKFRRKDGKIFDLIDIATGYKSFSILQLLLKNGTITDKTLMIIDEPESNLHPQWIIEYARIIVMMNKEIGCKFFLASHNPDMVSAIRYISEREGTLDKVNFYLAEKSDINFQYNYKHLGTEIDPIFESFNMAIDRINQYGI